MRYLKSSALFHECASKRGFDHDGGKRLGPVARHAERGAGDADGGHDAALVVEDRLHHLDSASLPAHLFLL